MLRAAKRSPAFPGERARWLTSDTPNGTWINVEGDATVVRDDEQRKRDLWRKDLERWFQNGPDDPEVVLIKVAARRIDAWAGDKDLSFDVPR